MAIADIRKCCHNCLYYDVDVKVCGLGYAWSNAMFSNNCTEFEVNHKDVFNNTFYYVKGVDANGYNVNVSNIRDEMKAVSNRIKAQLNKNNEWIDV